MRKTAYMISHHLLLRYMLQCCKRAPEKSMSTPSASTAEKEFSVGLLDYLSTKHKYHFSLCISTVNLILTP